MINQENVVSDIREFLGQFVSSGLVNSLFAMQLVLHIESEYGLSISNEDLDFDNFKSLEAIAGFIERKNGESSV